MARLKRGSAVLNKAMRRLAGMRSINDTLEFGNGLSLAEYETRIQTLQIELSNYNMMLSKLDEMAGRVVLLEQDLRGYSERMLMSVAVRYGKGSLQYVQAGGTFRKQSRRSPVDATPISPITPTASFSAEKSTTNGKGTEATMS